VIHWCVFVGSQRRLNVENVLYTRSPSPGASKMPLLCKPCGSTLSRIFLFLEINSSCGSFHMTPFQYPMIPPAKTVLLVCNNKDWDPTFVLYFAFSLSAETRYFVGNQGTLALITVLKIKWYGKGLTLRYNTHGGSGWWAPVSPVYTGKRGWSIDRPFLMLVPGHVWW